MRSVGEPSWSRLSRGAFLRPSRGGLSPASTIVPMCVSAAVVCDRPITNRSRSGDPDLQGLARERWRGPVPRPTVKRRLLINRSAGACPPRSYDLRENRTPAKAISRANRGTARDRPSPYGEGMAFFPSRGGLSPASVGVRERWRGTGPRPTVKGRYFFRRAGPVTATLSDL